MTRDEGETSAPSLGRRDVMRASVGLGLASAAFGLPLVRPAAAQGACAEDTLDKIKRTGVFALGARQSTPPYGYLDANNNGVGFAADLAGKRVGVPLGGLEEALFRSLNQSGRLKPSVTTVAFPDHPQGFTALGTGTIDGYASDGPIMHGLKAKAADSAQWRVFDPGV